MGSGAMDDIGEGLETQLRDLQATLAQASYGKIFSSISSRFRAPLVMKGPDWHFNCPAIETVIWEEVLPWIEPEKRRVVEVILDPQAWYSMVLKESPVEKEVQCQLPLLSRELQWEVISLNYVKKSMDAPKWKCPIFAVIRPDSKLRLIWNGKSLNSITNPPPKFHFPPLNVQLFKLLDEDIENYYTFDLKSWFTQLKPHHLVSLFFGTRLALPGS